MTELTREEHATHVRERALFWGCEVRTMQRMIAAGVGVDDPAAVIRWYTALNAGAQQRLTPELIRRIHEERGKLEGAGKGGAPDPDLSEFETVYHPGIDAEKDNLADIKREQAFYLFKMKKARARGDRSAEADAAKQYRNFSDLRHDCELRAQRLGRDLGESFAASDVDQLGRSLAFWLMNSAGVLIDQITDGISKVTPMEREAARKIVEPLVIRERVLAPLVRATKVNAGVKLPPRFVEAVRAGVAASVEDGAVYFDHPEAAADQLARIKA